MGIFSQWTQPNAPTAKQGTRKPSVAARSILGALNGQKEGPGAKKSEKLGKEIHIQQDKDEGGTNPFVVPDDEIGEMRDGAPLVTKEQMNIQDLMNDDVHIFEYIEGIGNVWNKPRNYFYAPEPIVWSGAWIKSGKRMENVSRKDIRFPHFTDFMKDVQNQNDGFPKAVPQVEATKEDIPSSFGENNMEEEGIGQEKTPLNAPEDWEMVDCSEFMEETENIPNSGPNKALSLEEAPVLTPYTSENTSNNEISFEEVIQPKTARIIPSPADLSVETRSAAENSAIIKALTSPKMAIKKTERQPVFQNKSHSLSPTNSDMSTSRGSGLSDFPPTGQFSPFLPFPSHQNVKINEIEPMECEIGQEKLPKTSGKTQEIAHTPAPKDDIEDLLDLARQENFQRIDENLLEINRLLEESRAQRARTEAVLQQILRNHQPTMFFPAGTPIFSQIPGYPFVPHPLAVPFVYTDYSQPTTHIWRTFQ